MTRREIVAEWMKGCSNTYAPWRPWWTCAWCFKGFMRVFVGRTTKSAVGIFMSGWRRS